MRLLLNKLLKIEVHLPFEVSVDFEVIVQDLLGLTSQTQVLQGKVPLLVDVAVVILRDLWWRLVDFLGH